MIIDRPETGHLGPLRHLWKQAFGDSDRFLDGFFHLGFAPDRCRCLFMEDQLAAALYWFDCRWQNKKVAYLYAVATDLSFRGQGLCRALMEDTHRHLQKLGYTGAALVPGNEGLFSLYEKLGYRGFCPMQTVTVAAGTPIPVTAISAEAYFAQRNTRLGSDAVLQDQNALDFFATYGGFYQAGDGVFAVSREKDTLYFQEYLADPVRMGGIVAALGAETGVGKLPGGEYAAMYLPLDGGSQLPGYLGMDLG